MAKRLSIVVVVALVLAVAPAAFAFSTVTADLHDISRGWLSAEYEVDLPALGSEFTLGVPVRFASSHGVSVFGIGAGVRYYVEGWAHQGIYVGATLHTGTGGGFGVTGEAGYKHVFDNGLVLDGGLLLGITGGGVDPKIGVGYAF